MVVRRLRELGGVQPDLSDERARDSIWALNDPSVWESLVVRRGWTPEGYSAWVGRLMADAVLEPAARG